MFSMQALLDNQGTWQQCFFDSLELSTTVRQKEQNLSSSHLEEGLSTVNSHILNGMEERSSPEKTDSLTSQKVVSVIDDIPLFLFQKLDACLFQEGLRANHVQKIVKAALKAFQDKIEDLNSLARVCLAYTGSDGREEKLSPFSSRLEMMCIVSKQADLQTGVIQKILTILQDYPSVFDLDLEVKCLETDSLICFNRNPKWDEPKKEISFPTRALDAHYLVGDASMFQDYKKTFYQQIRDPHNQKLLEKFGNDAVRATMRLFRRSLKEDKSHIDLAQGIVNYDNQRVKGTKFVFLRAIQYKLGEHVFKQIQKEKLSEEDFLKMPFTTVERIQWLADKHLLNMGSEQVRETQKAYVAALIWFGQSQKRFELWGLTQTKLPVDEIQKVAQTINEFCHDKKIFS